MQKFIYPLRMAKQSCYTFKLYSSVCNIVQELPILRCNVVDVFVGVAVAGVMSSLRSVIVLFHRSKSVDRESTPDVIALQYTLLYNIR